MDTVIDRNAECYYKSFRALFMPAKPVHEIDGFELKLGKRYYLFRGCETPFNNCSSASITGDKYCTNKLLERAGIPVPKAVAMHVNEFQQDKTEEKIAGLTFPLVIKPLLNSSMGTDVLCNIQTIDQLKEFLATHFMRYPRLIIEEFHGHLKSYRVLVFNQQVIGVVLRSPACVVGDGKHTIQELIDLSNMERKKNNALGPIKMDSECQIRLQELGISADHIPISGERIVLCYTSNATRGGTFQSLGNQLCRENKKLMIKVASLLNLNLTGIDVECADINLPLTHSNGVIIEVNHRPSVRIHEFPLSGRPNRVTKKIVRSFIYRHPVAYVLSLFSNRKTAFYLRSVMVTGIVAFTYWWLIWFDKHPSF